MSLKLAICCGNKIFAEGLKRLLRGEPGVAITGMFHSADFLHDVQKACETGPDVILADATVDLNAFASLSEDCFGKDRIKILLLGDRDIKFTVDRGLQNLITKGIVGILPPGADVFLLRKALKAIAHGELWIDRETLMRLMASMRQSAPNTRLAQREKEIIQHIRQGYKNKEIAQKLNISEQTVKAHCNRIYRKLGVADRLQLAIFSGRILPPKKSAE